MMISKDKSTLSCSQHYDANRKLEPTQPIADCYDLLDYVKLLEKKLSVIFGSPKLMKKEPK